MKNKFAQQQRFLQKMALTPQMRQSLNLLGMSINDLNEYVDFAVSHNPFLKKLLDNKYSGRISPSKDFSHEYDQPIKQDVDGRSALLSQIRMAGITDDEMEIAEYLVYEMDENGYIAVDPEEAAGDLGVDVDEVTECLTLIQSMEPPGIGARDIKECLELQLKRKGKENSLEYRIISRFLSEVAQENIEKIAKELKADRAKVKEAVNTIKKLNPRPASTILAKESDRITPELMVRVEKDKVRLELNRGSVPGLKLYNPYENDFNIIKDPEARKFMKENANAAKHLIDNLKRREDTVCKVADFILKHQKDSLINEDRHIKSLTINHIAKELGFHPSTISRTISNKYIQINDKVVPLKNLLSHSIKHESGELRSKTSVKKDIEALIKHEDPSRPASDGELCRILKEVAGINISRRTVAKYRNSLRILPAHLRKKVRRA